LATTALVTADRSMTNCGNKKCLYEMKTHISKHETFFCIVQRNPLHRSLYVKGFGAAAVRDMSAKKNFAKK
jgi:hypothetical protein